MARKPEDIAHIEPLVVRPLIARRLLGNLSEEKLWELINSEALKSFRVGGARYIELQSIKDYIRTRLDSSPSKKETPRITGERHWRRQKKVGGSAPGACTAIP